MSRDPFVDYGSSPSRKAKARRKREAIERHERYISAILAEMGRIQQEEDAPEDEIRTLAKRNIDWASKARYDARKK